MTKNELEPISPAAAKEMYLEARKNEVSQSTIDGYHYRLKHFIRGATKSRKSGSDYTPRFDREPTTH